jgi:ubiquinone/menaquinone biosynthesis C-methylase UbiE
MNETSLQKYYNQKAKDLDELALTYNHKSRYKRFFFRTRFNNVINALAPKKGEKILDVGCGTGYYLKYILDKGAEAYGLDLSEEYIKQAKAYISPNRATLKVASASNIPFKSGYFDQVLATEVIEHVPNYEKSLKEVYRVLRSNGSAVITTINKYSYMNIAYALKRIVRGYKFNEHVIEFSQHGFLSLLTKYFKIDEVFMCNFLVPYPLDNYFIQNFSARTERGFKRIEKFMSNSRFLKSLGWTIIVKVSK